MPNHYPTVNRLEFKDGVKLVDANLDEPMVYALRAAMRTAPHLYQDTMVVTSAADGQHSAHSLHYVGRAWDIRTLGEARKGGIVVGVLGLQTPVAERQRQLARMWAGRLRQQLGAQYDVLAEADHIHVEFDPKP